MIIQMVSWIHNMTEMIGQGRCNLGDVELVTGFENLRVEEIITHPAMAVPSSVSTRLTSTPHATTVHSHELCSCSPCFHN